jgi:hypothetical protein
MQKDTRFIIETVAMITQIAKAHYQPAIEDEPQRQTIEVDRRLIGRMIAMAQSEVAGLNNGERRKLEQLAGRLAEHYGNQGPNDRIDRLKLNSEVIDIPDSAIYSRSDAEKMREIPMWGIWTRTGKTLAVRMTGPFACVTANGLVSCKDGYLALDPEGYPYPIERDIFEKSYSNEGNEQISGPAVVVGAVGKCGADTIESADKKLKGMTKTKPKAGKR